MSAAAARHAKTWWGSFYGQALVHLITTLTAKMLLNPVLWCSFFHFLPKRKACCKQYSMWREGIHDYSPVHSCFEILSQGISFHLASFNDAIISILVSGGLGWLACWSTTRLAPHGHILHLGLFRSWITDKHVVNYSCLFMIINNNDGSCMYNKLFVCNKKCPFNWACCCCRRNSFTESICRPSDYLTGSCGAAATWNVEWLFSDPSIRRRRRDSSLLRPNNYMWCFTTR